MGTLGLAGFSSVAAIAACLLVLPGGSSTAEERWSRTTVILSDVWAQRSEALLQEGRRLEAIAAALKGHPETGSDEDLAAQFSRAHLALYTAYRSFDARLPMAGRTISHYQGVFMSPDRSRAITFTKTLAGKSLVELWDMLGIGEKDPVELRGVEANTLDETGIIFSDDSRWIAGAAPDGNVLVFAARDGELLATLNIMQPDPPHPLNSGQPLMFGIDFSPSGAMLMATARASVTSKPQITRVWSIPAFSQVLERKDPVVQFQDFTYSHYVDEETICRRDRSMPGDNTDNYGVEILGLAGSREHHDLRAIWGDEEFVSGRLFCSADLRWLYFWGSRAGTRSADLVDLQSRTLVKRFHHQLAGPGVFSPDSTQLAVLHGNGGQGWDFLDLATGIWLDRPPGSPEGYVLSDPRLYSDLLGQEVARDTSLFVEYGSAMLWEEVPTGSVLAEEALQALPSRLQQDVDAERIR